MGSQARAQPQLHKPRSAPLLPWAAFGGPRGWVRPTHSPARAPGPQPSLAGAHVTSLSGLTPTSSARAAPPPPPRNTFLRLETVKLSPTKKKQAFYQTGSEICLLVQRQEQPTPLCRQTASQASKHSRSNPNSENDPSEKGQEAAPSADPRPSSCFPPALRGLCAPTPGPQPEGREAASARGQDPSLGSRQRPHGVMGAGE